ncbi:MAG TPA: carbonic anhydrase [Candidatus Binataceae bacterium]|nr:carbonic anhydrase [Candidatus Binataceae bacterium]
MPRSRRALRSAIPILSTLAFIAAVSGAAFGAAAAAQPTSPAEALRTIMAGNARFAAGHPTHPNRGDLRRIHLARGQNPFVAVLSCSDSRVPPEIVFGQGLGDVFVVRVAGNSVDPLGLQTLAYAVDHLGTRLIVVLGHDSCGAVKAAVESYPKADAGVMLTNLYPAVAATRSQPGDRVSKAIDRNVELMVAELKAAPPFADRVKDGRLMIVGGRYHLKSGKVTIFPH